MPVENIPASSQSDGRHKISLVPSGSSALSVAILNGATVKPLTYSFTAGGFNYTTTQANVPDPRLTLLQNLDRPGKLTDALELTFVDSVDLGSAAVLLPAGLSGQFIVRRGVDNATAYIIGQVVDVITFVLGVQRPAPPTENGLDTLMQTVYFTAPTIRKGVLVA